MQVLLQHHVGFYCLIGVLIALLLPFFSNCWIILVGLFTLLALWIWACFHTFPPFQNSALALALVGSCAPLQPQTASGSLKCQPSPHSSEVEDSSKKPRFWSSTVEPLPACAVCLGRHPHRVVDCTEERTWDKKFPTFATHSGKSLFTHDHSQNICSKWQ